MRLEAPERSRASLPSPRPSPRASERNYVFGEGRVGETASAVLRPQLGCGKGVYP